MARCARGRWGNGPARDMGEAAHPEHTWISDKYSASTLGARSAGLLEPLSLLSQGLAPSRLWGDTVQPLCSAGLLVSCPALYKHGRKTPAEYLKSSTGSFNASA